MSAAPPRRVLCGPILAGLILAGLILAGPALAESQPAQPAVAPPPSESDTWSRQKCALYALIFRDALTLQGHEGLSNDFLATNQRFIDAGCTGPRSLCPLSEAELAFADMLTLMTMNEGMASTFVPFGCPAPDDGDPATDTQ